MGMRVDGMVNPLVESEINLRWAFLETLLLSVDPLRLLTDGWFVEYGMNPEGVVRVIQVRSNGQGELSRIRNHLGHLVSWRMNRYLEDGGQSGCALNALGWYCVGNAERVADEILALKREFGSVHNENWLVNNGEGKGAFWVSVTDGRLVLGLVVEESLGELRRWRVEVPGSRVLRVGSIWGAVSQVEVARLGGPWMKTSEMVATHQPCEIILGGRNYF